MTQAIPPTTPGGQLAGAPATQPGPPSTYDLSGLVTGSGFSNLAFDNNGSLVITGLHSPNFAIGPPIVGWSINSDGTADFAQATVLDLEIVSNVGINTTHGVFFNFGGVAFTDPYLAAYSSGNILGLVLAGPSDDLGNQAGLEMVGAITGHAETDHRLIIGPGGPSGLLNGTAVSWENFNAGGQYYEEVTRSGAITLNNGSTTIIYDTLVTKNSNRYAAAYNTTTGVWTCPADGYYIISAEIRTSTPSAAARLILGWTDGGGNIWARQEIVCSALAGNSPAFCMTRMAFISAGTTLTLSFFNGTGVAMNTSTDTRTATFKRLL